MKIWFWLILTLSLQGQAYGSGETLIVGDSLTCGPFGKYLFQEMNKNGSAPVSLYCAVSSAPQHWIKGKNPPGQKCQMRTSDSPELRPCGGDGTVPTFKTLLSKHKGAKVIVALGTNSLLGKKADGSYLEMAKLLQDRGHECQWIGPPHMNPGQSKGFGPGRVETLEKNLNSFYQTLSTQVSSGCEVIDSREATSKGVDGYQTTDGVHRTDVAGLYWLVQIRSSVLKNKGDKATGGANKPKKTDTKSSGGVSQ